LWRESEERESVWDLQKKKWEEKPFIVGSKVMKEFGAEEKAYQQRKATVVVDYLLLRSVVGVMVVVDGGGRL